MELNVMEVETAFQRFSGEIPDVEGTDREALCGALCAQCARQVQGQLRQDLTETEFTQWESALEELAAAEAFYQLLLTDEAVTPQSLTAGEVKLTGGRGSELAERLAAEKRKAAAPALRETAFYFGSIRKEGPHDAAK